MANNKAEKQKRTSPRIGSKNISSSGVADWMNASPTLMQQLVAAMAYTGGALRFGYTRDGGAYALGVYGDGDPYTLYCKPSEDIDQFLKDCLADIAQAFADR